MDGLSVGERDNDDVGLTDMGSRSDRVRVSDAVRDGVRSRVGDSPIEYDPVGSEDGLPSLCDSVGDSLEYVPVGS